MSVEAMAAVLHHSRTKGTVKLVLLGIANHDGDGGAWPSVSTLARYANVHPRNVQRAIDQLVAKGELRREVQAGGAHDTPDHDRPNRYHVLVTCPPWCDRSHHHRDTRATRQPGLWTKGVARTPPPGRYATPPLADTPPPPVALAPPKPSTQPDPPSLGTGPQSGWCDVCGMREHQCRKSQRPLAPAARHDYTPSGRLV